MKKLKIFIAMFLAIVLILYGIYYRHQRVQWSKVYQKLQYTYWGKPYWSGNLTSYGEIELEDLYLDCDIVIYPDQFSGNTYVINAKGDTIFKYIKREKE